MDGCLSRLIDELGRGITMKAKEVIFNWKQTGTNCDEPILELVPEFGHKAKIYKSFDNKLWSCIVDGSGKRGIESEQAAKDCAEAEIKQKIGKRIERAKSDLTMLTDWIA